ncbi:hypothetical protein [Actinacidiphila sp. ITFR-21]|uniref:hypothetical protein n=1 Tax=Actinacidiphila sp. ITFR-21 TaxID=3075199 RepID=UPI00288B960F|nr:hypothetical protein [Streptomyces sp. ITFR-21]WNI16602.1 hypothetical protein RLT57_14515 [Streptomyces sp. ITFR-21]
MEQHPDLPELSPGDTARLDQLAATWRDQSPQTRAAVDEAARALQADPSPESIARLMAVLRNAGLGGGT